MTAHTITLANRGGATYEVDGRRPLLKSLLEEGVDLPYGCKYGGCITCAAKLIEGEVNQAAQVALNNRQIADGYIVLCVARALSDCVLEVGVDSHDKLYRNPFARPAGASRAESGYRNTLWRSTTINAPVFHEPSKRNIPVDYHGRRF